jgi:hypothetical protein
MNDGSGVDRLDWPNGFAYRWAPYSGMKERPGTTLAKRIKSLFRSLLETDRKRVDNRKRLEARIVIGQMTVRQM